LRRSTQQRIDAIKAEGAAAAEEIKAEAEAKVEELRAAVGPRAEVLAADIATLEAQAEEALRAKVVRERAERTAADADAAERRSEALTAALARVEALKTAAISKLPIEGLEIRDGALFLDGHPFARVNQARRVQVALMLAQLRAKRHGGLPLVCVDGLECLDEETFAAFCRHAPKVGLQLVVARVGEGPLAVTEIPAAEVAG
jgi:4-hydroxy-L-threonine phosphate dehydrogenase PdxA